jgi:hypothetical protein
MVRCPSCGAGLETRALPDLPRELSSAEDLQEPAFRREQRLDNDTAPLSEFIAAGAVLAGMALLIASVMLRSGIVALVGVVLIFGVTGFFAISKGSLGRAILHFRLTMWTGRHPDEIISRDRDRKR